MISYTKKVSLSHDISHFFDQQKQSTFRGLFPGVPSLNRLHSEIDQIHLSIEAQCGTACLPIGDCHRTHRAKVGGLQFYI